MVALTVSRSSAESTADSHVDYGTSGKPPESIKSDMIAVFVIRG